MQLNFQGFTQQEFNTQASNCPWWVCLMSRVNSLTRAQCFQSLYPQQVAIIGRPNVGKSAMFNRLVKRRSALVSMKAAGDGPDRW